MRNLLLLSLMFLTLLSCSSDDNDTYSGDNNPPPNGTNAVRLTNDTTFGSVLNDSEGFTLYFFAPDSNDTSNCNGGCADVWPPFYVEELTLDAGLTASDFGTVTRDDGSRQTTFKGWPLYRFSNDAAPGDINGDGSGGVWFVAKPDYTVMVTSAQLVGRDVNGNETNLTSEYLPGDEDTFYITDANGNTLYSFINDFSGVNNFTAEDFANNGVWPIFEESFENAPSILDAADFGSIDVFGRQQLTYKGWTLYYFGQDTTRGDNFGVGFPAAGVWPVLNQDSDPAPIQQTSISYEVSNQAASAYLFTGEGLNSAVNPDITLQRGETYEFVVNAPGHPFLIKSEQTTGTDNTYNNGVTNNGAAQGTVTFTVPNEAPDTLFYVCEFHGPMTGTFNIVN